MASAKQIFQILLASVVASVVKGNCNQNFHIQNQEGLNAISGCTIIKGDINIDSYTSGAVRFAHLTEVIGSIKISGDSIDSVYLGDLKKVTSLELSGLSNVESLALSKLEEVDTLIINGVKKIAHLDFVHGLSKANKIELSANNFKRINKLDMKKLTSLKLNANPEVPEITFANLETLDSIEAHDLAKLNKLIFPKLQKIKSANVNNLVELEILDVPVLNEVGTVEVNNLHKFKSLSFPELKNATSFDIRQNKALESLSFAKLGLVTGDALIMDNTQAIIDMPNLIDARGKLFFNGIKDVKTPKLTYVTELKYEKVEATTITIDELFKIKKSIQFSNNAKLTELNLPKLTEVMGETLGLYIFENPVLTKIALPALTSVKNRLQINEPTVTEFIYNKQLSGANADIVVAHDICNDFKTLKFSHDQCAKQGNRIDPKPEGGAAPVQEPQSPKPEEQNPNPSHEPTDPKSQEPASPSNGFLAMPAVSGLVMVAFSLLF